MNIFKEEATVTAAIVIIERAIPVLAAVDPAALLGVAEDRATPMRAAADPAVPERRGGGGDRTSCQQGRGKSHRLPSKRKRRLHPRVVWERWKEEEEEEEELGAGGGGGVRKGIRFCGAKNASGERIGSSRLGSSAHLAKYLLSPSSVGLWCWHIYTYYMCQFF